jgi:hypothetical protein
VWHGKEVQRLRKRRVTAETPATLRGMVNEFPGLTNRCNKDEEAEGLFHLPGEPARGRTISLAVVEEFLQHVGRGLTRVCSRLFLPVWEFSGGALLWGRDFLNAGIPR